MLPAHRILFRPRREDRTACRELLRFIVMGLITIALTKATGDLSATALQEIAGAAIIEIS